MVERREWQGHLGEIADREGDFDVIRCEACGFLHVVPLPSESELESIYAHDYYTKEKPLYLEEATEDLEWWRITYRHRYEALESMVEGPSRRILDIGSGPGFFLQTGVELGWDGVGVEPSKQAHAHSVGLGLDVRNEHFGADVADGLGVFDVVHFSEVLEHVRDPISVMNVAVSLIRPGGVLCVSVPNDYNPLQQVCRDVAGHAPWWVAPPHHLNYFDFESLERLVRRCGLDLLRRETSFPMELFLLMGDNYVGNAELGRACHGRRKRLETALVEGGLEGQWWDWLQVGAEAGIGRTAIVYARR